MSRHLEHALHLMRQDRGPEAIREFRAVLAEDPDHVAAHACLAILHSEREEYREADDHARQAVTLAPEEPFAHYALAKACFERNRFDEARAAIDEAIRLDPDDAKSYAILAAIHLATGQWRQAVAAADAGLALDPEHSGCTTARSHGLLQLGEHDAAASTIEEALRRSPDAPDAHATRGWTLLHAGEPKKAVEHFREALRLDPTSEYARRGIVEALKARNPVYRLLLGYFLWMGRLSPRLRWGLVVGGFFAARMLAAARPADPAQARMIGIALAVYTGFALLTWVGGAVFNLLLLLDPLGRHALDRDQRHGAILFGALVAAALLAVVAAMVTGSSAWLTAAIVWGLTALVSTAVHSCDRGWPRTTTAIAVAVVGALAAAVTVASVAGGVLGVPPGEVFERGGAKAAASAFFPVWFLTMILSQVMARQRVRH